MRKTEFKIAFGANSIVGDVIAESHAPSSLFLHGAGTSHRKRFDPLRDRLAEQGIGSVAFDFVGHGETGGDLKSTSLKERVEQAEAVIRDLHISEPLSLVGSSMGAYVAVKLTEKFLVKNLILFVPAMYDKAAYEAPFSAGFSELIRNPGSWRQSDAYEILQKFTGNLLVFAGGRDEVIPKELIDLIEENAANAVSKEIIVFPEADHGILRYFGEDSVAFKTASEKIAALLRG